MTRTCGKWYVTTLSLALVLSSALGIVMLYWVNELNGQARNPATAKSKPAVARDAELGTDLEDAIRILEQSDFQLFLERYAPVEILRQLRQQNLVERATKVMSGQPQTKKQLLSILKVIRKQTPTFDKSRGLATIQFDIVEDGVEEATGELHLPITDDVKLVGLGDDLNKVLVEAARLLDAGDFQTFVERLFPASELAFLQEPDAMQDLLQQFKVATDSPKTTKASRRQKKEPLNYLQTLKADFKRLQETSPELAEGGQVAVFRIESPDQKPERVIKFQKTGNDWRFFDNAGSVITELARQSKLKPRSAVTTIQMELIGGNWRFIELPALNLDGK